MTTEREHQQEGKVLGWTLRLGSYGSVALIALGSLLFMIHANAADTVLRAGFLLLMFTPAIRIVVAGIMYLKEKDYRYALVSLVVLSIVTATSVLSLLGILPQLEK
jgi:uncharacterized membrane protein